MAMTHNTREVEESIEQVLLNRIKLIGDEDQLYTGYPQQLIDELVNVFHHQLQKARTDWLREEIVRLEGMRKKQQAVSVYKNFRDDIYGYNLALQTIIDRYSKELDQDKV